MATLNIDYQLAQGTGSTGEPVRKNTYEVEIPELAQVQFYAQTFKLPQMDVEQLTIRHFNAATKIAGKVEFKDATLKIRDVVSPDLASALIEWHRQVFDPDTKVLGFASDYKKVGFATRYDSRGDEVRKYTLKGLWPKVVNHGDMDYSVAEGVEIEVELSCDSFTVG